MPTLPIVPLAAESDLIGKSARRDVFESDAGFSYWRMEASVQKAGDLAGYSVAVFWHVSAGLRILILNSPMFMGRDV